MMLRVDKLARKIQAPQEFIAVCKQFKGDRLALQRLSPILGRQVKWHSISQADGLTILQMHSGASDTAQNLSRIVLKLPCSAQHLAAFAEFATRVRLFFPPVLRKVSIIAARTSKTLDPNQVLQLALFYEAAKHIDNVFLTSTLPSVLRRFVADEVEVPPEVVAGLAGSLRAAAPLDSAAHNPLSLLLANIPLRQRTIPYFAPADAVRLLEYVAAVRASVAALPRATQKGPPPRRKQPLKILELLQRRLTEHCHAPHVLRRMTPALGGRLLAAGIESRALTDIILNTESSDSPDEATAAGVLHYLRLNSAKDDSDTTRAVSIVLRYLGVTDPLQGAQAFAAYGPILDCVADVDGVWKRGAGMLSVTDVTLGHCEEWKDGILRSKMTLLLFVLARLYRRGEGDLVVRLAATVFEGSALLSRGVRMPDLEALAAILASCPTPPPLPLTQRLLDQARWRSGQVARPIQFAANVAWLAQGGRSLTAPPDVAFADLLPTAWRPQNQVELVYLRPFDAVRCLVCFRRYAEYRRDSQVPESSTVPSHIVKELLRRASLNRPVDPAVLAYINGSTPEMRSQSGRSSCSDR
ncbi:hypothetical protein DIPPA_02038 [Diplonema papillatum]|nr:hypothetical protein DIPPA_02038 [Diplonema papillatum]